MLATDRNSACWPAGLTSGFVNDVAPQAGNIDLSWGWWDGPTQSMPKFNDVFKTCPSCSTQVFHLLADRGWQRNLLPKNFCTILAGSFHTWGIQITSLQCHKWHWMEPPGKYILEKSSFWHSQTCPFRITGNLIRNVTNDIFQCLFGRDTCASQTMNMTKQWKRIPIKMFGV